jgi:hypothetical protein
MDPETATKTETCIKDTPEWEQRRDVLLEALAQPVPAELVKHGTGQYGFSYDYVEWYDVADLLDQRAPGWSHELAVQYVPIPTSTGGSVVLVSVTATISIDYVSRQGLSAKVVTAPDKLEMLAKYVAQDALKRAAVMFGLTRELYHKAPAEPAAGAEADDGPFTGPVPQPGR